MAAIKIQSIEQIAPTVDRKLYQDLHLDLELNYTRNLQLHKAPEITDIVSDYDLDAVKNSLFNLFSNTSLIICGASITIFEAIRLEKPVIAISLSKEQSMHVECLHKLNLINGLYSRGEFNSSQLPIFKRNILEVCEKYLLNHIKREQSSLVIDSQGARRVASMIINIL